MTARELISLKKLIEIADILSWKPCDEYSTEEKIISKTDADWPKTPVEILRLDIPIDDRFWVVMRKEIIAEKQLGILGCDIAEHVLNCYEDVHPGDNRPRVLIETKRKWIAGEATDAELDTAMDAAMDTAMDTAMDAAMAAAMDAARDAMYAARAAWAAARAAGDAARDAEVAWQIKKVTDILEGAIR